LGKLLTLWNLRSASIAVVCMSASGLCGRTIPSVPAHASADLGRGRWTPWPCGCCYRVSPSPSCWLRRSLRSATRPPR
jgi:hypothetical protein